MTNEYLNMPDFLRNKENLNAEKEAEELICKLDEIYQRTGWREVKQLVIHELEIKKRLSELLAT